MISIDTNVLLPAVVKNHSKHVPAAEFLLSLSDEDEVMISEFVLLELYVLLRNPVIMPKPLTPRGAVEVCAQFRKHPRWQLVGFPENSPQFHDDLWLSLQDERLARRRAYDCRTAKSLLRFGVNEFATENIKDFEGFGFSRVWNPLA